MFFDWKSRKVHKPVCVGRRLFFNEALYDQAIIYFKKIIEKDPLKEDIYALLIKAQALSGNRKAVLDVYKKLTQVLDEELGLKPKLITRKIYYEMLSL